MGATKRPVRGQSLCPIIGRYVCIFLVPVLIMLTQGIVTASGIIDVSGLSAESAPGNIPGHWRRLNFPTIPNTTLYRLEIDPRFGPVIKADAANSASILSRILDVDPAQYPELSWSWKISKPLQESSLTDPGGDDFPARILVSFGHSAAKSSMPEATLCYVWAAVEEVGRMVKSSDHAALTTIVASNNAAGVGGWNTVKRNIVEDYRAAYGTEPPRILSISLMTDADDTDSRVSAWYGPIELSSRMKQDS